MSQTKTTLSGVIHGRTIELDAEPGLPDGERVSVIVRPATKVISPEAFEAFKRAAGGWADDDPEGLEQYLEQTRLQRKVRRPEIPE